MDTPSLSTSQARRLHPNSSIPGRNPGTQPCPLVTDEETEAQASGAAQSPQDRVGTEGHAISTPETVLLPFQETLRGEREAEVQGGWEMLPGRRVVGWSLSAHARAQPTSGGAGPWRAPGHCLPGPRLLVPGAGRPLFLYILQIKNPLLPLPR